MSTPAKPFRIPPILEELEKTKLANARNPKPSALQPNLEGQKLLLTHSFASKFIKDTIRREVGNLSEKYKTGDFRRRAKITTHAVIYTRRIASAPSNLSKTESSIDEFFVDTVRPTTSCGIRTSPSRQEFVNSITRPLSKSIQSFSDTTVINEKFQIQADEESKNPLHMFEFMPELIHGCKVHKVTRNGVPVLVTMAHNQSEHKSKEEFGKIKQSHHLPGNHHRKNVGVILLVDPCVNTYKQNIVLRVCYSDVQAVASNGIDITREKKTRDYEISSDGNFYGLSLTTTASDDPSSTDPSLQPINATITCTGAAGRLSLPGWGGILPIYIPHRNFTCALHELHGSPLVSLFFAAIPCLHLRHGLKKLQDYLNTFCTSQAANLVTFGGIPALNLAALHGNIEAVTTLLAKGADPSLRSKGNKYTALHEAVAGNHREIVQLLISHGANQLLVDDVGNTPLHLACVLDSIAVASMLMKDQAGKKALMTLNKRGLKPIDVCKSQFLISKVEGVMRNLLIFVKKRDKLF